MEVKAGYKQTEVGVIPEDWDVLPIEEAYEICNNLRLPISRTVRKQMEGPYPYYGPTSIQGYINEYRVEGEYALIGEDGDHFLKWQEQQMTLLVRGRFNVNNHAHLIKGTKNLTAWFYYYFAHRDITPYLTRQGAGRFKLNKRTLVEIPCVLPPRHEQEAIVKALSDADALIEALEQLIAKKRQVKQGIMQELLTGKRRLRGFSDEWKVKKLGELCTAIMDGTHFTPKYVNDGIPFYSVENVTANDFSNTKFISLQEHNRLIKRCKPETGDILMTRIGSLGDTKLINWDVNASIYVSLALLKVNKQAINGNYLYAYTESRKFIKDVELRSLINAIPQKINMKNIGDVPILVPSTEEQTVIAETLSDMDAEIAALEGKLSKARQIKQGMMSMLLTGRIRLV
ncbi:MAG TPA: restriction endonuclease subunit S [Anaerolineales bacterium]|nr:restriction endonuclease subunit S [Anaerolineales bacterium]